MGIKKQLGDKIGNHVGVRENIIFNKKLSK